jgi:hypothetical protein
MRKARRAAEFARDIQADKSTRSVWREHARQHVKAARREHWLVIGHLRSLSGGRYFRRTVGAHGGHIYH